jgi:hypothetical protein
MKKLILVLLLLTMIPALAYAQSGDSNTIKYGEIVEGELTNIDFDQEYTFEGSEGDVVIVRLIADENADFDPLLYLATSDNEILAQNDDFSGYNARIIYRLPDDGEYMIVATRLGERTGYGSGAYELALEDAQISELGVTIEGVVQSDELTAAHVFVPEADGIYDIEYNQVRGGFYPTFVVQTIPDDATYYEEVASISGIEVLGGTVRVPLKADQIYILTFQENYYSYSETSTQAVYTINITGEAAEDDDSA